MKRLYFLFFILAIMIITNCSVDEEDSEDTLINYVLSMAASSTSIQENGGSITLSVSLNEVNQGPNAIDFSLDASSLATLDQDYRITGTQSIASGSQSTSITIASINDTLDEQDETIVLTLQENLENVSISNSSLTLTIVDDDETVVTVSACAGTADTYLIDLDPNNCGVDIQTVLNVTHSYSEQVMGQNRMISSNSIPNHNVGQFPTMGNPNTITEISSSYTISASPTANNSVTLLTNTNGSPQYRFGILKNGILLAPIAAEFFVNTQTSEDNTDWNENALSSAINLGTDCNNAHVFPSGMYHHHATPSAYIASLNINGSTPVQVGWAADGFPIYYKYANKNGNVVALTSSYRLKTEARGGDDISAPSGCPDGTYTQDYEYVANLGDLDECNGYQDPQLGYIYVITDTYPSIPRCFQATPSDDFRNN